MPKGVYIRTEEQKRKLGHYVRTPESRQKLSYPRTDETRRKLSQSHKGKKPSFTGANLTIESVHKMKRTMLSNFLVRIKSTPFEDLTGLGKRLLILSDQSFKCPKCNIGMWWNSQPLIFQLHHKDGNDKNDSRDNLEMLCPNCHTQTDTFGKSTNADHKLAGLRRMITTLNEST